MVETPVIKVGEYRGVRIYVRRIARETFEYLIAMDGEIFCNQVEIRRPAGQRMAKYSEEDQESAIALMLHTAENFVDDRLFEKQEYEKWENRIGRFKKKVVQVIRDYKYKLLIYIDNEKTKWRKG